MSRLDRLRPLYGAVRERTYEVLEVAAPGDGLSRAVNVFILVLVLANVAGLGLEWRYGGAFPLYFQYFEWFSVGVFSLEYVLRLWSCVCAGPRVGALRGRLRYALRPLSLIDLAAVLPFYLPLLLPFDLRFLRLLRLLRLVRLVKLTRYLRARLPEEVALAGLLEDFAGQLKRIHGEAMRSRDRDLARVHRLLERAVDGIRRVQQGWLVQRRRGLEAAAWDEIRAQLTRPVEELATELAQREEVAKAGEGIGRAFESTAACVEELPEWASLETDLQWKQIKSYRRVPIRRVARHHFKDLTQRYTPTLEQFLRVYENETAEAVDGALRAMRYVLDQEEKSLADGGGSQAIQVGFDRAVNRLRDLDRPVQAAWDDLLWRLEEEQQERLGKVRTDIRRYGSPMFYLGRLGRWSRHGLAGVWALLRLHVFRLLPLVWSGAKGLYGWLLEYARPVLLWVGLVKQPRTEVLQTLDEIRLDYVRQRGLPEDYLDHFAFGPLTDEALFVGFDAELAAIDQAIQRWERGVTSSFLVHGQRGGGKTSLLNLAARRLFDADQQVVRDSLVNKVRTADELAVYLDGLLDLSGARDFEALAAAILDGPRRAVVLEGCHNLFERRIGGLEVMRHLCWLIARTNHHVLWGLCMGKYAYIYLDHVLPMSRLFHFEIAIQRWDPKQLRQLVMLRHHQSGYGLRYAIDDSVQGALRRRVKRWRHPDEPAVQEALAELFFERLTEVCGENILTAFYYWLRSLQTVEEERFEVHPMKAVDLGLLRSFSLDQNFILAAILQHDNLTAPELAAILDADPIQTRLELEIMSNQNIVEFDLETRRFRMNAVAFNPVAEVLASRNILH